MKRSPLVAVAGLVLSMALSPDARAGCNTIPDAESAMVAGAAAVQAPLPAAKIPPLKRDVIGFKTALGRMDRPYLIPGHTRGFRIQPDGQCVHATERGLTVRKMPGPPALEDPSRVGEVPGAKREGARSDYVVSLLTQSLRGEGVQALVLAEEEVCDAFETGIGHEARRRGIELRCEALAPVGVTPVGGPFHVAVALPDDRKLYRGEETAPRGPVKVVLTRGKPSPAEYFALLSQIAAGGCAASCDELMEAQAEGCADSFFVVLRNGEVVHDKIPCEVGFPPVGVNQNDFQALCEDMDTPSADLAHCGNAPTGALQLWEDSCGGVHIPFDWTEIRKTTSTPPTDITRVVAGRSATSRTEKGRLDDQRIWIPGREFLGSTPWTDPSGTYGSNDWRKTDIDVWYPGESPEEVGLRGSTDQANSIVHVYPRMPVYLVCKNGSADEACMGVGENGGISCACGDRDLPATCSCESLDSPKYFACDAGEFKGMPCTRHAHCDGPPGRSGNCSMQPSCRQDGKNGVWPGPFTEDRPPVLPGGGAACWNDDNCRHPKPVCGYRLFDLSDRWQQPSSPPPTATPVPGTSQAKLIELDVKILPGERERRGVCKNDRKIKCNHNSPADICSSLECRGFTLRAEGMEN